MTHMGNKTYRHELNRIKESEQIYIYGAGDTAKSLFYCLRHEPFTKTVGAFVVSDLAHEQKKHIFDIPVISYPDIPKTSLVVIAVMEKYRDEIIEHLKEVEVNEYIVCTFESKLWYEIRKHSFFSYMKRCGKPAVELKEILQKADRQKVLENDLVVYVAKSDVDKAIGQSITNQSWERDIQVGAALTQARIANITDATGDHISGKNRQYCEMTALYWIWKNTQSRYAGLSHYRRRFDLSAEDMGRLQGSDIDIVFTIPMINVPDVRKAYERIHLASDWEVLRDAVKAVSPEYMGAMDAFERGNMYIPYNMFIMKKEIMDNYCEWAFRIFHYCEEHFVEKNNDPYQRRDIGFISERVMSIYFLCHGREYNIAYADKIFYE